VALPSLTLPAACPAGHKEKVPGHITGGADLTAPTALPAVLVLTAQSGFDKARQNSFTRQYPNLKRAPEARSVSGIFIFLRRKI
jgi:hypothetical protein